ncbi:MAG: methyltransferase domain-containing protein [Bacteroidota bacterium]
MGSSDSYILKNLAIKKISGELHGVDLREPNIPIKGVKYSIGDLMNTKYSDHSFRNITCLSVIEHEVDFNQFAKETSRLLEIGGRLFVTFDYWNPKVTTSIKLYGLAWQPLDKEAVINLMAECKRHNLYPVQEMDWTLGEAVINKNNESPDPSVGYTFGLVTFEKRFQ